MTNPIKPDANLYQANLYQANLSDADLRRANLRGADLRGANLIRADLRGADLIRANLRGADLRDADLRGADLSDADLQEANIYSANFNAAYLCGATFTNLDVRQGPIRSDGYQYILFVSDLGGCVIRAGCRTWSGQHAFEEARQHCREATRVDLKEETFRILDFLEKEFKAMPVKNLDLF